MMWLSFALAQVVLVGVQAQTPPANGYYPGAQDPNIAAGVVSGQTSPPSYPSPWQDGSGGWAQAFTKAQAFVKKLTLIEKVNLTTGVGWQGERCVGQNGGVPRLGFRSMCLQDGPIGVRFTDGNSVFPAGGTVAASWDRNVWYQRGFEMASEFRDKGVDVLLGPAIGPLGRSPEGGRNWEGFSPDPVLSGIAVAQTVKGIQDAGVIACTKHLIGNEQEHFRSAISANIDDRTMHETYLWPFADAIRAGTGSIMCSYNLINNSYACQNSYLINHLVKNELGFQGFMLSDWGAQNSGVASTLAGLDMTMPGDVSFAPAGTGISYWGANLTVSFSNGTVPLWRLNDMATRIVAAWYYVGRDDTQVDINFSSWNLSTNGYLYHSAEQGYGVINEHVDVSGSHGDDIREMSARSTVLLKNLRNTLPLDASAETYTAVFGNDSVANPLGPNGCKDRSCDMGTLGSGWGSGTANYPYLITPLAAITNEANQNGASGTVHNVDDNYATSDIIDMAGKASVALVFINSDSGEAYLTVDTNMGDRNNLTAWIDGDNLVQTVADNCDNTVVIIHSPGPLLIGAWNSHPNVTAILWAGMPGEESGNAIADVLYGRVNPGAKLPFTLGQARSDYGTDVIYKKNAAKGPSQLNFVEGNYIDYRAFDRHIDNPLYDPLYEFGFGLSYTTFSYSKLKITKQNAGPYTPTTGNTGPAPTFGKLGKNSTLLFPKKFKKLQNFIYPYLSSTNGKVASGDPNYGKPVTLPQGALDATPQPKLGAGGGLGGNPGLYDVLYKVTAQIKNTGTVDGEEVPQLYINLGGSINPRVVLRNFDRLKIPAGKSATFSADITRRDISNWDIKTQNWVVTKQPKTVYVGSSSRKLPLSAVLP